MLWSVLCLKAYVMTLISVHILVEREGFDGLPISRPKPEGNDGGLKEPPSSAEGKIR